MSISMVSLLMHSPDVPAHVREALRAAHRSAPEQRAARLASAARLLVRELPLDCADVRELVGLPPGSC